MKYEVVELSNNIKVLLKNLRGFVWKKKINENLIDLKKNLENQKNWDDFEKTNKDLKKLNYLSSFLKSIDELQKSYEDTIELIKITDENTNADMYLELETELKVIERNANTLHIETLMSGKADSKNVLLEIHSGAGGVAPWTGENLTFW